MTMNKITPETLLIQAGFSLRTFNALAGEYKYYQIDFMQATMKDLVDRYTLTDISRVPNIGKKSIAEIVGFLSEAGLEFKGCSETEYSKKVNSEKVDMAIKAGEETIANLLARESEGLELSRLQKDAAELITRLSAFINRSINKAS